MHYRVYIGKCHRLKNESHLSEWVNVTCLFSPSPLLLSCLSVIDLPLPHLPASLHLSPSLHLRSSRHIQLQVVLCTSGTDQLIWSTGGKSVYSSGPGQEWIHWGGGAKVRLECVSNWMVHHSGYEWILREGLVSEWWTGGIRISSDLEMEKIAIRQNQFYDDLSRNLSQILSSTHQTVPAEFLSGGEGADCGWDQDSDGCRR